VLDVTGQRVFYGIRVIGTNRLVEVGDYTDLDMGSFTTLDGVILSRSDVFDDDDLLELMGDTEMEVVEVSVSIGNVVRRIAEGEEA